MEIYTKLVILWGVAIAAILGLMGYVALVLWRNRDAKEYRSAAEFSARLALIAGIVGLVHWAIWSNEPIWPFAFVTIPIFYVAPVFVAAAILHLAWGLKAKRDRE